MGTEKRQRQKEGRQARIAAAEAAQRHSQRRRKYVSFLVMAVAVLAPVRRASTYLTNRKKSSKTTTSGSSTTTGVEHLEHAPLWPRPRARTAWPSRARCPRARPPCRSRSAPPPTSLVVKDLKVGHRRRRPRPPTRVTVNYIGVSCSTGKIFDSSWSRGQTATFGLDQVINGWTQGIPGMKVGGERLLGIPAGLALRRAPARPPGIAPDEPLWFVVDMVSAAPGHDHHERRRVDHRDRRGFDHHDRGHDVDQLTVRTYTGELGQASAPAAAAPARGRRRRPSSAGPTASQRLILAGGSVAAVLTLVVLIVLLVVHQTSSTSSAPTDHDGAARPPPPTSARAPARPGTEPPRRRSRSSRPRSSASTRRSHYSANLSTTSVGDFTVSLDAARGTGHREQLRRAGRVPLLRRHHLPPGHPRLRRRRVATPTASHPGPVAPATPSPTSSPRRCRTTPPGSVAMANTGAPHSGGAPVLHLGRSQPAARPQLLAVRDR